MSWYYYTYLIESSLIISTFKIRLGSRPKETATHWYSNNGWGEIEMCTCLPETAYCHLTNNCCNILPFMIKNVGKFRVDFVNLGIDREE